MKRIASLLKYMEKADIKSTEPKSFARRDFLKDIEKSIQATWKLEPNIFEANAPPNVASIPFEDKNKSKYFMTFPYPYMNGRLHLGHALSFCKCEFQNRYQKMLGKNSLLPFSFHCTGMPILAAANRMKNESKNPTMPQTQHLILKKMGVDDAELEKFSDADYWLNYFPNFGKKDLIDLGVSVDWRRSFITTQKNPYYDSFVRWQFNLLKAKNKIAFGNRPTVYSTIENQPCADHDRSEGEGVMPQEYTLIKIKLLAPFPQSISKFEDKNVFLVAATLRPETMYGQTNCFILPEGEYGLFEMKSGDIFISSDRAAKNLSYQHMTKEYGKVIKVATIKGSELIGCAIKAPLTSYEKVYVLPMMNISMKKGTGVVTSVPSDAPDDYATLRDLQKKKEFREKFGLKDEQVLPFNPISILEIPEFGNLSAVYLCDKLKIVSQNDKEKLKQAKDMAYLKGFNEGIMTVGLCKGEKVSVAKNKIKEYMIKEGLACQYWEPESQVISRSGDDCVVALCDQWMIKYGEEDWKNFVKTYVKSNQFNCFNPIVQKEFETVLDWLKEWACSRTFGQGTKLPWDNQFLIESLSDSTIYMAYYTISHFMQGNLDGSAPGKLGITPDMLSDDVFDYIYLGKPYKAGCKVKESDLQIMRNEFLYWYPMDLRCSAKDLIKNHFTMSLYNHAAIWEDYKFMPRAFFCNGYVCVDSVKMSKSVGNFIVLKEAIDLYGADATRFAIADSGDGIDDPNFERNRFQWYWETIRV
jgi:leucyl-tRNA synthetase